MRDLKILLELLKEDFINNWEGEGLCIQVSHLIDKGSICKFEAVLLRTSMSRRKNKDGLKLYLFKATITDDYYSDPFKKEIPLRIEWLDKFISEL